MRTFWGYRRDDGKVGIRNHVLILPASICASDTTRLIASNLNGAVTFNLQLGCSQVGKDFELTLDTLAGYGANPNVYGVIIVGLGCETAQVDLVKKKILERTKKPIETLVIQEEGGTLKTIAKAQSLAKKMIGEAALVKREEFPLSELILGTNCGGSDTTSGLAANPTIGRVSDKLVEMGATSVLCETTEFIGAEHILARRAKNKEVHDKLYEIIKNYEEKIKHDTGLDVRDGNPSPGNIEGGLTTLEEKSLGCIHKGGTSIINNIYDYSKQIKGKEGLVIMDTPGNDASSVGGIIAGGCQLVVFSTGRGTPTGHAIAPVIKITGNSETYARMSDNIDYDASKIITENKSIEEASEELLDLIVDVCNGKLVQAELLGYTETAIQRASAFV
ncbi:UxaA family hydrolase [Peptoniphilus sp.]|uniref:UxaA family hydrolase n=1 Tax=Peptoniphilus sp. TaxID=1971214 RepID=UPI00399626A6